MKISDLLVRRKGYRCNVPNVDNLPEIDFDAITQKTHLKFTNDICKSIIWELATYVSQVRGWETKPLGRTRKAKLKAIEKACKMIEYVLELEEYGAQDEYDPMQQYLWKSVIPGVECFLVKDKGKASHLVVKEKKPFDFSDRGQLPFDGRNVAEYLVLCRRNIQRALKPSRPGNREKYAVRRCLRGLHQDYLLAGGEGRGCSREADGSYAGSFLMFSKMLFDSLIDYTGISYSEGALHEYIANDLKL